jgi:hypothetical protein
LRQALAAEYRAASLALLCFCLLSIAFVAFRSRRFWCETGAVAGYRKHYRTRDEDQPRKLILDEKTGAVVFVSGGDD